jgi:hypothetical protein
MRRSLFRWTFAMLAAAALATCLAETPAPAGDAGLDTKAFHARHELTVNLPKNAKLAQIWFTLPQESAQEKISNFKLDTTAAWRKVKDSEGNEYVYVELRDPKTEKFQLVYTFDVVRSEVKTMPDPKKSRPLSDAERQKFAKHLEPNKYVVINDEIRKLASQIVGAEQNPVVAARKIYDWVLDHIEYWVKDPKNLKASAEGSTQYCLTTRTGNCTDFHSLYASLTRAAGIPTQIVYGSLFKPELDSKDVDQSYHCWIEFYAPGIGWVPLDVAIADIFAGKIDLDDKNRTLVSRTTATGYDGPDQKLVDYYFGNLEARRVTWSRGRDLQLQPPPTGGPVNAMSRAYIEVDGKELPATQWTRKLTFKELKK